MNIIYCPIRLSEQYRPLEIICERSTVPGGIIRVMPLKCFVSTAKAAVPLRRSGVDICATIHMV
jgi:hypothetical protein